MHSLATNFPTSLDNFTNPVSGNTLDSPSHSLQHSDANDAIEAIEAKLGVGASPAGSATAGQVLTISAAGTSAWTTPSLDGLIQIVPSSVAVGSGSGSVSSGGAITFSGASSVSINDCFSSTYDNYLIVVSDLLVNTGTPDFLMRLRVSNADNSSSQYSINFIARSDSALVSGQTLNATSWNLGTLGTADRSFFEFKISNVFKAQTTNMITQNVTRSSNSTAQVGAFAGLAHAVSTSYTGFSIYPSSGNMTGSTRIYGLRNG